MSAPPRRGRVYESAHRILFSELDPYQHVRTGTYATLFVDHRMACVRDQQGWDLKTLETLPFMVWVRRLEIDFLRPARADEQVTIRSFVREFRGPDASIELAMLDGAGKALARCLMTVAYVDKKTQRGADWPPELQAGFFAD